MNGRSMSILTPRRIATGRSISFEITTICRNFGNRYRTFSVVTRTAGLLLIPILQPMRAVRSSMTRPSLLDRLPMDCYHRIYSPVPNTNASPAALQTRDEDAVRLIIMESPTKSCTLDPIPTFLLNESIDVLLPFIINASLQTGYKPTT